MPKRLRPAADVARQREHALNRSDDGFGYLSAAVAHAVSEGLSSNEPPAVVVQHATDGDTPCLDGTTRAQALERFAFYKQMARASVIIQCGEMTPYGNVLLCKGLITQPIK